MGCHDTPMVHEELTPATGLVHYERRKHLVR